ncbi:MAG: DUF308 domain-containing protein [Bacteroidota bacterium]
MNPEKTEKRNLTYWWFPLVFGVIFILIGLWILKAPVESLKTLTKVIGLIIVVSGTAQVLFTATNRKGIPGWGFQLTGGIIDMVIGVVLIVNPGILLKIITLFVGVWLIFNSVTVIMKAAEARQANRSYWKWELIFGVALLLTAILFFWHPMILGTTIGLWTALAFIILGLFRIVLTFRLKSNSHGRSI